MKKLFPGRFAPVAELCRIFLGLSLLTRIGLMFYSAHAVSFHPWELIKLFAVGFFFDVVAFGYFMIPYILITFLVGQAVARTKIYKGLVWFFFSLTVFIFVFNAFAEFFFWDEFEVRYNFIAVDYLIYTNEVVGNIQESYPLPLLVSIESLLAGLLIYRVVRKGVIKQSLQNEQSYKERGVVFAKLMIVPVFAFVCVNLNWAQVSKNSYNSELAKNGIYSIFEAYKNNQLDYNRFYLTIEEKEAFAQTRSLIADDKHVYASADPMQPVYVTQADSGSEKRMNVMFVTVESLSGEYMGYINEPDDMETPFLDSLADNSLFFSNMYANGTRTVRGLEALNLSIPPTPGTSIVRRPGNEHLYSLGEVFKSKGYQNKFIYGGFGYFDNMNAFFAGNGYEIIDRNVLKEDEITFANVWGACDQDMYVRAIKEADKSYAAGKPFLNFIMTTSNHRPYTFPEVGIKLTNNRNGGVRYTDYALQWLFNAVKDKPWYKETIFVVVADHCGSSAGKTEIPVLKYQIPCMIFAPGLLAPQKVDKLCSQVDVMPTLLKLLNWSYPSTFYGRDILTMTPDQERAFVGTYQKLGYIRKNELVVLSPQKRITQYTFDRMSGEMKATAVSPKMQKEVVSLYQSAEYMFVNGLNKVSK